MAHIDEIHDTYDQLSRHEAFEVFKVANITPYEVGEVCGMDAESEYANWIYENLK